MRVIWSLKPANLPDKPGQCPGSTYPDCLLIAAEPPLLVKILEDRQGPVSAGPQSGGERNKD